MCVMFVCVCGLLMCWIVRLCARLLAAWCVWCVRVFVCMVACVRVVVCVLVRVCAYLFACMCVGLVGCWIVRVLCNELVCVCA